MRYVGAFKNKVVFKGVGFVPVIFRDKNEVFNCYDLNIRRRHHSTSSIVLLVVHANGAHGVILHEIPREPLEVLCI